jgi:hypothetical protein
MGILTDFFVAADADLPKGFAGWRVNTGKQIRREMRNPFTGKLQEFWDWEGGEAIGRALDPKSQADCYYTFLKSVPSVQWKRVDPLKLASLYESKAGMATVTVEHLTMPALIPPDGDDAQLFRLPFEWIEVVAGIESPSAIAEKWMESEELSLDGWTFDDTNDVIQTLKMLAQNAIETKRSMFLRLAC